MIRPRANDFFRLLFDPRVPLLFVLGWGVLAVLGNGVYEVLKGWLRNAPEAPAIIAGGALLTLVAVASRFWTLLTRRSHLIVDVPWSSRPSRTPA